MYASTAPVVGFSVPRPGRELGPSVVNVPPMNSRPPASAMSLTTPFIGGNLKPGTSAPVVVSSSAMPLNFVPLTLLNAPPTYTVFGFGPGSSALTWPSRVGANPVSSAPVVASTASRSVLVTAVVDPDGVAEVKLPPTKTLLPTWVKAWTEPSPMFGVPAIGTVPTRLVCLVLTAPAVSAPTASVATVAMLTAVAAAARAAMTRLVSTDESPKNGPAPPGLAPTT